MVDTLGLDFKGQEEVQITLGTKNLSEGLNVPFLGQIPLVQSIRESGDIGAPAVLQCESLISSVFDELVTNFVTQIENNQKSKINGK